MEKFQNIAVLIDADNTQLSKLENILKKISLRGRISLKRAYGNWKKESLKNWESELSHYGIKAQQQFDYVAGKNATDMLLVIDAIHLMYTKKYDCFVIVSSDSDYTPLAIDLHESCVYVIGAGKKDSSEAFVNSCDEFIFLENTSEKVSETDENSNVESDNDTTVLIKFNTSKLLEEDNITIDKDEKIHKIIEVVFNENPKKDGFVSMGLISSKLKQAEIDIKNCGYASPSSFILKFPEIYEVKNSYFKLSSFTEETAKNISEVHKLIKITFNNTNNKKDGFVNMGEISRRLKAKNIVLENYGYSKISEFLKAFSEIYIIDGCNFKLVESKKQENDKFEEIHKTVKIIFEDLNKSGGFANMGQLSQKLKDKNINLKIYGYSKISKFLKAFPEKYVIHQNHSMFKLK